MIKISSDEGREDCQKLKPKGTEASFGTTVIAVTILLIPSILFSRVTVNVLVYRAVNPQRHQILRIDREEMIDDVISHDK